MSYLSKSNTATTGVKTTLIPFCPNILASILNDFGSRVLIRLCQPLNSAEIRYHLAKSQWR